MHVAEGEGRHVAAALAEPERLDGRDRVVEGRVEVLVDLVADAVLLAADDADLDLEDGVDRLHAGEQLGWRSATFSASGTADPSHMCDWKIGLRPAFTSASEASISGMHEAVERVLGAVVGVQRDGDRIVLGDLGREGGEGEGSGCAGLDALAGEEVGATGRHLDDAVGAGLGETLQHGVDRGGGGHVDGGEGEPLGLGGVEHLGVLVRSRDWHGSSLEGCSGARSRLVAE